MPPKSARMRSGGIPPPSKSEAEAPVNPTYIESDPAFDFLAAIPSPVTLPASNLAHVHSGSTLPSPPKVQVALLVPSVLDASDSAFDFMDMIPSPVIFSSSQPVMSGAVPATAAHVLAQSEQPWSEHIESDPFAFLDMVCSPIMCLRFQEGQSTGIASRSLVATSPPSPPLPPPSQPVTLPDHIGAGDSYIMFMAKLASQNASLSMHSDQSADNVCALSYYS